MNQVPTRLTTWLLVASLAIVFTPSALALSLQASRLPTLPTTLTNNAVTSVANADGTYTLYSFMGMTNPAVSFTATTDSYRLDWPGGDWTPIRAVPRLNNRGKVGGSAITVAGSPYVIGGYTIVGVNELTEHRVFRYDPSVDDYEQVTSVPMRVDDTVVGVYQDRYIYLVSGWHGPINDNIRSVQIFDTQTSAWQTATDLPGPGTGVFGHAGSLIGDQLVSFDGTWVNGGFVLSDKVYAGTIDGADLTTIDWQELPAHPGAPTYRAAASQVATSDGRMLVLGGTDNPYNYNGNGYNGQPADPLDQALLYDPIARDWESIDIVGDALATMDHRGLVKVGDGWATIGGMTGLRTATDQVVFYQLVPEPAHHWLVLFFTCSLVCRRRG